jgi:hypothetical protein
VLYLLEEYASAIDAGKNIVTAAAIIAAAFWFVRRRLRFPRARVQHCVNARHIGNGRLFVRIQVKVDNVGDVLMRLKEICLYVQQVRPLDSSIREIIERSNGQDPISAGDCELPWPALLVRNYDWRKKKYEIEPGELESYNFDAIFTDDIETIQIYTHIVNRVKWFKNIGWNETSIYDINTEVAAAIAPPETADSPGAQGSTAATQEGLGKLSMAEDLKKQAPVKDRPPLTQGPKKDPVVPTSPPKKR